MELAKMLLGYFGHPRPIHFLASPARSEFANKSRQQLLNLCGKYYTYGRTWDVLYTYTYKERQAES